MIPVLCPGGGKLIVRSAKRQKVCLADTRCGRMGNRKFGQIAFANSRVARLTSLSLNRLYPFGSEIAGGPVWFPGYARAGGMPIVRLAKQREVAI